MNNINVPFGPHRAAADVHQHVPIGLTLNAGLYNLAPAVRKLKLNTNRTVDHTKSPFHATSYQHVVDTQVPMPLKTLVLTPDCTANDAN